MYMPSRSSHLKQEARPMMGGAVEKKEEGRLKRQWGHQTNSTGYLILTQMEWMDSKEIRRVWITGRDMRDSSLREKPFERKEIVDVVKTLKPPPSSKWHPKTGQVIS